MNERVSIFCEKVVDKYKSAQRESYLFPTVTVKYCNSSWLPKSVFSTAMHNTWDPKIILGIALSTVDGNSYLTDNYKNFKFMLAVIPVLIRWVRVEING